jgi:hypothetical protein
LVGASSVKNRPAGVITSSTSLGDSWCAAKDENAPRGRILTAMRSVPDDTGAQIEYWRRTPTPPRSVRTVTCCPWVKRKASRSAAGTSKVIITQSSVGRSTRATLRGWKTACARRSTGWSPGSPGMETMPRQARYSSLLMSRPQAVVIAGSHCRYASSFRRHARM